MSLFRRKPKADPSPPIFTPEELAREKTPEEKEMIDHINVMLRRIYIRVPAWKAKKKEGK